VTHFDREAERAALGAMMLDSRRVWDVLDIAQPGDFHDPVHEVIATAIHRLATRGSGTDAVLVEAEIAAMGDHLPRGPGYLFDLSGSVTTASNAGYYAEQIVEHAQRRRLADAASTVNALAADRRQPVAEQIESARAAVDAVARRRAATVRPVGDSIDDLFAAMTEPPVYTPTPWRAVNDLIGGLRPRAFYVVGARPASGKTNMGLNMATALAVNGNVAVSSLEMGEEELQKRLVSQLGEVHMTHLVNNALDDDDWRRAQIARPKIMRLPLFVDDRPGQTLAQIRSHVRSVAHEGPLAGVVVDYLQLVETSDPRKDRRTHLGEVSRALKVMAKEFDCPVIALAQLNRKSEERAGKKPMLSDLKETGDIEQDADVVLLLSRDTDDPDRLGEVDVQVAKNRHGNTGEIALAWQGHFARMKDMGAEWAPGM
jgi:replicative DNA helicase